MGKSVNVDLALIRKWHDTLLSGAYKQGRGFLKSGTPKRIKHCCMGVLCEVVGSSSKKWSVLKGSSHAYALDGEIYEPSPAIKKRIGIDTHALANDRIFLRVPEKIRDASTGEHRPLGRDSASMLNDRSKLSFKQIAAVATRGRRHSQTDLTFGAMTPVW